MALQCTLIQGIDEVNALPGWVAKVFHGTYPMAIADQQAQLGGIAVHRFHCEGGKTVFSAPCFLAIQQAVRGQHAAELAI
ncbi:hypothetical protein [Janthinobacterium sp. 78]|uniref:hypothetical protein n=1 Tax=Janthinobacterium sp. 78 TaxID=2135631 RepID=UPI0010579F23|nr:hypothetical protein [Janthinobacterium sp. 78]